VPGKQAVVAPVDYAPLREDHSDISATESATSVPSSIFVPTWGWMSANESVYEEAALALDTRGRSCHLCYNTGHFLMDCPLIGAEAKEAAQKQRDQKIRENPAPRFTPSPPTTSPTHLLTRTAGHPVSVDSVVHPSRYIPLWKNILRQEKVVQW
jgi:hypothetical protein